MDSSIKIGLIQMTCEENPADNLEKAICRIELASKQGAKIVCLQELYRSLYFCQKEDTKHFSLSETLFGESTKILGKLAKKLSIVIIAPIFEKRGQGIYHNTAVVLDVDGCLAGKYRKMHIPDDPYYYEKFYFTPGDIGFTPIETTYGKIGILICWDQWFPEAARLSALAGAQFLFYPTAIGYQKCDGNVIAKQHSAWETVQRSHAITNGLYVFTVNRVGTENKIQFWGQSFACDPFGEIIARASAEDEEVLIAICHKNLSEQTRQDWPFLRDRRIDFYDNLTKLYIDE